MNICNYKFYQRKNVFWKLKDTRYEDYFIFFLNKKYTHPDWYILFFLFIDFFFLFEISLYIDMFNTL